MGEAKWRRIVEQAFEAVHETLWTTIGDAAGRGAEDLDEMARQAPPCHPGSPIPAAE
jgi:hypothetical protein